jgi:hypothetical protein
MSESNASADGVYCDCGKYYYTVADLNQHIRIANADAEADPPRHKPVGSKSDRKRRVAAVRRATLQAERSDDMDEDAHEGSFLYVRCARCP